MNYKKSMKDRSHKRKLLTKIYPLIHHPHNNSTNITKDPYIYKKAHKISCSLFQQTIYNQMDKIFKECH